ncbi:hypothetical protein [Sideroxydans sp. CL21]|uniref:hypothetical protein n=1 Tax=Sideroxydans sp. CL21 TaxID=2600596 RepID=UPI0024BD5214|nr:hypothetical protein [Sideroxydans sp. CL21]
MIPNHPPEIEVESSLVSTGMARGLHTWIAVALVTIGLLLGVIAQKITAPVLGIIFLACAIGLLGEVPCLLRSGQVRARQYSRSYLNANKFFIIRKVDSPGRFYFYVVIYTVLGIFAMGAAGLIAFRLITH